MSSVIQLFLVESLCVVCFCTNLTLKSQTFTFASQPVCLSCVLWSMFLCPAGGSPYGLSCTWVPEGICLPNGLSSARYSQNPLQPSGTLLLSWLWGLDLATSSSKTHKDSEPHHLLQSSEGEKMSVRKFLAVFWGGLFILPFHPAPCPEPQHRWRQWAEKTCG